jgi:hypothetical protein
MKRTSHSIGGRQGVTRGGQNLGKNRIIDSGHFTRTIAVSKGGSNKLHKTLATWHKKA